MVHKVYKSLSDEAGTMSTHQAAEASPDGNGIKPGSRGLVMVRECMRNEWPQEGVGVVQMSHGGGMYSVSHKKVRSGWVSFDGEWRAICIPYSMLRPATDAEISAHLMRMEDGA